MGLDLTSAPQQLVDALRADAPDPVCIARGRARCDYRAPIRALEPLAEFLALDRCDVRGHEALFLGTGAETGALFCVAIHRTTRGQAQGGVRRWTYATVEDVLRDALRLSLAMTRKNALAHLWWGGGKGIIVQPSAGDPADAGWRRSLYREWGAFVSSLRGCYVTAEDVGTGPADMAEVSSATRFVTCLPPEWGGAGNPSIMTAEGVACAMEAALDFLGRGSLRGKSVAIQGAGQVGGALIEILLGRGVERIVASELDPGRREALLDAYDDRRVEVRLALPGDAAILAEPCDVLAPCALGDVLDPKTIPHVQARLVCGSANHPLADIARDAAQLAGRGITYVPDFLANRMGVVSCANEQYGHLVHDSEILRHLDPNWSGGIYQTTQRVLETAQRHDTPPVVAAIHLADALADLPHPIWGHRAHKIILGFADRNARAAA